MAEITLVDIPSQPVLGVERKGRYAETGSVIGEIMRYARANGAQPIGMPVALMHEIGAAAAMKADRDGTAVIDVAVPIARPVKGSDVVKCYELPGGKFAKTVHRGPYETCGSTYAALVEWLGKMGMRITGPTREVALNDPRVVKPADILFEIYAPVG